MNYYNAMGFGSYSGFGFVGPFFMIIIVLWSLYWKGRALWLAARKGSLYWFVALLVINTVGILEILYIFYFSKKDSCCSGDKKCEGKKDGECCGGKGDQYCKEWKCEEKVEEPCGCGHEHK